MNDSGPSRQTLSLGAVAMIVFSLLIIVLLATCLSTEESSYSSPGSLETLGGVDDPRELEGWADGMAWRLCSYTISGEDIEDQLVLVISLDQELFEDSYALQVSEVARRLQGSNLTIQEIGEIATELDSTCRQWRRADAERLR